MTAAIHFLRIGAICDWDEKTSSRGGYLSSLVFHRPNTLWRCAIPSAAPLAMVASHCNLTSFAVSDILLFFKSIRYF
jgi:hypothetical protein